MQSSSLLLLFELLKSSLSQYSLWRLRESVFWDIMVSDLFIVTGFLNVFRIPALRNVISSVSSLYTTYLTNFLIFPLWRFSVTQIM